MRLIVVILLCVSFAQPIVAAEVDDITLEEILTVARGGAPGLALRLLDEYQLDVDMSGWMAAERERIAILAARGKWAELEMRGDALPEGLPQEFLDWRYERQAEALLQLERPYEARRLLSNAIWSTGAPDEDSLRQWRRLLVRAYLQDGQRDAALIALRRYVQDYGQDDAVLRALHGEALLVAGRPDDAFNAIGDGEEEPLRSLRWLARLGMDAEAAGPVLEQAIRAANLRDASSLERRAAWRVAATAAGRLGNRAIQVAALERALLLRVVGEVSLPTILTVRPAELWTAYGEWGVALGNAEQLIIGVDQDWVEAADARSASEPAESRALYVALARHTPTAAIAEFAHHRFARSLAAEQGGGRLVAAVYLDGAVFGSPGEIPAVIRYDLVDEVLRQGDVKLASELIDDLVSPPPGAEPGDWAMRRARVLVLAGRSADGAAVLHELMDTVPDHDADRVLQVLFDMQTADAHAEALTLFSRVLGREDLPMQSQREVLFWMADSQRALGEYAQAARLYLRSAGLSDPYSMDPWAQTARYQAAEVLARAGLRGDAVVILQALLNITEDPARRVVLRQQIEQFQR